MNYTPTDMVIDLLNGIVCEDKEYETCMEYLKDLKTIEEELGIDLITLFNALKNGYWYKKDNEIIFVEPNDEGLREMLCDYGKTWALDEKELTSE